MRNHLYLLLIFFLFSCDEETSIAENFVVEAFLFQGEPIDDIKIIKDMLNRHVQYTQSTVAENILNQWSDYQEKFVKVMPEDYKRVLQAIEEGRKKGMTEQEAIMEAAHG